jgi:hypothetical protein
MFDPTKIKKVQISLNLVPGAGLEPARPSLATGF